MGEPTQGFSYNSRCLQITLTEKLGCGLASDNFLFEIILTSPFVALF